MLLRRQAGGLGAALVPQAAGRGKKSSSKATGNSHTDYKTATEHHTSMTWAQRLKRVFGVDIETREKCELLLNLFERKSLKDIFTLDPQKHERIEPQMGLAV